MLYLKEDNVEAFVMITLLGTELPYLWAHIPERVLYKGDCVKSGYSEIMIAQFILNCRLFK